MRAVIQRVTSAEVTVGDYHQSIGLGYLILLGIHVDDEPSDYDYMLKKILSLRIFEDAEGKMNLSLSQVNGSILLISQFTLLGSVKGNNRPSFTQSAKPDKALDYYLRLFDDLSKTVPIVKKGLFGEDMKVSLTNQGPVTIIIDTKE
ncbi:D-aminoacyl-tRNA deacylase [Paracholeplasma manati]|jgi:D-tyrosyl-tRNA(Tyr) deacylase|uniref:D-aminoacyl-tRNA deacylase n=1 Tax=Paracholeplasma manati TaxID=591373 RepID=A0ABT2Y631_9MOLU|nr:D-aminoacyl-tRNA deacylase [Paracholeplasma manati]MCV2232186.1 D-aminoacyl-tRNA deacylase [Paracholeplasma manati]MDG0888143.1 D-aminoacyl-tRNA deacylase [Paracholeplasma manati]MDX9806930.1 D-aminoacyl-tRNA deacylase [Acholeplasma sp.]